MVKSGKGDDRGSRETDPQKGPGVPGEADSGRSTLRPLNYREFTSEIGYLLPSTTSL